MKSTSQIVTWFVLLVMTFAFRPALVTSSQIQAGPERNFSVAVQTAQTMKWKFGGNDGGSSSYETRADGTFESSTDLNIAETRVITGVRERAA
jgi:hypothetical protein